MIKKINLEDLSPQTAFPSSIGKEKELSLVVYNTLVKDFEKKDVNIFIIELLMSINESNISSIKTILKYEIDLLKDLTTNQVSLVFLNKIKIFFEESSLENITVFSSLAQGIPEIKSNIHFREELSNLSEILEDIIVAHIDSYKDINENNEDFKKVNDNSYFLTTLLNIVKNYSIKNIKRLASDISSKMSIEEQVKVFSRLFKIGDSASSLTSPPKQLSYDKKSEEEVEEAIIISQDEDEKSNPNDNNSLLLRNIISFQNETTSKFEKLIEENSKLKEEVTSLTKSNIIFMKKFESFIDNQASLQKVIKEKYNIEML